VARTLSRALARTAAVLAAVGGCDRGSEPAASTASTPAPSAAPAPARRHPVASEASFDLALTADGALLVWAAQGEIRALPLDRAGIPRGEAKRLARAEPGASLGEIAAASSARLLAVGWIERAGDVGVARAALGDPAVGTFAEAVPISAATSGGEGRRGSIALATDGERMVAFVRGEPEPCRDDRAKACTRFAFSDLAGPSPRPRRVPLSVPSPCAHAIAGIVVLDGRWHYAVCSTTSGREVTTTFRIQYEPRYAEAHEVLAGCSPAGATRAGEAMILAADCKSGRRGVRVAAADAVPAPLDLAPASVECARGRPLLSPIPLHLSEARDGLAPLLPADVAPLGSRAVWTGTTLLVARYVAGHVAVHRYGCEGAVWSRLPG
jgi:hypothetical protein